MTNRATLVAVFVVLIVALLVAVWLGTPWRPLPMVLSEADPSRNFSSAEIEREDAFHAAVRPPAYLSMALVLAVSLLLGLTPLGARLVGLLPGPWPVRVLVGGFVLTAVGALVALPLDARAEVVLRQYGLSTRGWGGWAADTAKSYLVGLVVTLVVLFGLYTLVRWSPHWWWAFGAAAMAALVVVLSFVYPVVVEPLFNKFVPMESGPLRSSLLAMAEADEVPARDVLVADASRRTSTLNAYVSGFGATRRIVVYDTLLKKASDDEVRLVVAHELGHAKRRDVLWGTLVAALGSAAAVCLLALLLSWSVLLRRSGVLSLGDPRSIALALALIAVLGAVAGPPSALVSRRVEARADVHSLDLTRDPAAFAAMQRRLSVTNLSDLNPSPLVFGLFATHPTAPQRIALARDWARLHGLPPPPDLAP
jgi:STE24 endopeptidase